MIFSVLTEAVSAEDLEFLRGGKLREPRSGQDPIRIVDLFSGCGGLSVGAIEGARRSGRQARVSLAVDHWESALDVYRASVQNLADRVERFDLGSLPTFADRTTMSESIFAELRGEVDLLVAGPPCQGHSALNNRTRHDDARNGLYMAVPRVARLVNPRAVIIENVPGISRDRQRILERSLAALQELGYRTSAATIDLSRLGAPQKRRRHLTVAVKAGVEGWTPKELESRSPPRTVGWAISDLLDRQCGRILDTPSRISIDNERRIDWLFANDAHDLPNSLRPPCHQNDHSYKSMYGRLYWDRPAQTITSGFGSMGQGRFVHPLRPRALTPHEAARLQFLPDTMSFDSVSKRTELSTMIGNAAPPVLTIAAVQALVAAGSL